jgi:hypothetical protein
VTRPRLRALLAVVVVALLGLVALVVGAGSPAAAAGSATPDPTAVPHSTRNGGPVTDQSAGTPFLVGLLLAAAVTVSFFAVMILITRGRAQRRP